MIDGISASLRRQLKSVLEMYGHFSGINRKVQLKYQPRGRPPNSSSEDGSRLPGFSTGFLFLIQPPPPKKKKELGCSAAYDAWVRLGYG